ncbi:hypothetical protein HPB48_018742 [Haemaphysalis longicornis]|uniref:Uncharacterized protein n=1 Tax=Haemaphysalis longicornis TaxID=44386 RepID=A0A9J6GQQ4_HAELO|nr:hypothetical protein HPB48_018742 [Haemaphysalis longicornis]
MTLLRVIVPQSRRESDPSASGTDLYLSPPLRTADQSSVVVRPSSAIKNVTRSVRQTSDGQKYLTTVITETPASGRSRRGRNRRGFVRTQRSIYSRLAINGTLRDRKKFGLTGVSFTEIDV